MSEHFNAISSHYDSEIAEHIRLHLLAKKTQAMHRVLAQRGKVESRGLDCGCGTGHYLAELTRNGFEMFGFEYSVGMLEQARLNNAGTRATLKLGSITEIPFEDASFDFAYTINVLHHLPDKDAQGVAVREMLRIVRPGGLVFLQDFDADNPLVRLYMNIIFPLTSTIDDDETEIWVSPRELRKTAFEGSRFDMIDRFTLVPNFTPRWLFPLARGLEAGVEALTRPGFGAHFMMVYEKVT